MRISRQMANEVGLSPQMLLHFMTHSPSPKKKLVPESLIETKEMKTKHSEGHDKENIGIERLPEEETQSSLPGDKDTNSDSISSLNNGGSTCIPMLKLKKQDSNVLTDEPISQPSTGPSLRRHNSISSSSGPPKSCFSKSSNEGDRLLKVKNNQANFI